MNDPVRTMYGCMAAKRLVLLDAFGCARRVGGKYKDVSACARRTQGAKSSV